MRLIPVNRVFIIIKDFSDSNIQMELFKHYQKTNQKEKRKK